MSKEGKKPEFKISKSQRGLIDTVKKLAIEDLRNLELLPSEYDHVWRSHVITVLHRTLEFDLVIHVAETEKDSWIRGYKKAREEYLDNKKDGWAR